MIILSTRTLSDSKYWKYSDRYYDSSTSDKDNGHDTVETDIDDDRHKGKLKSLQTRSYCSIFSDRSILIAQTCAFASTKALTLGTSAIFKLASKASISVNTILIKTIPTTEEERYGKKANDHSKSYWNINETSDSEHNHAIVSHSTSARSDRYERTVSIAI